MQAQVMSRLLYGEVPTDIQTLGENWGDGLWLLETVSKLIGYEVAKATWGDGG